jgi:hypothetical protein
VTMLRMVFYYKVFSRNARSISPGSAGQYQEQQFSNNLVDIGAI